VLVLRRTQCCDSAKRYNLIPPLVRIMENYRSLVVPVLPWVKFRQLTDPDTVDAQADTEPRLAHYCVQCLANLACDEEPEMEDRIAGFKVRGDVVPS
jgi:hypothetical protein